MAERDMVFGFPGEAPRQTGLGVGGVPVTPGPQYIQNDPNYKYRGGVDPNANDIKQKFGDYIDPNSQTFRDYEMGGDPNFANKKAEELRMGFGAPKVDFTRNFGPADTYRSAALSAGDDLRNAYLGNGPSAANAQMRAGLMRAGVNTGNVNNIRSAYGQAGQNANAANAAAMQTRMGEIQGARSAYNNIGQGMSQQDLTRQNNQLLNDQARNGIMDDNMRFRYGLGDTYLQQQQNARVARAGARQSALEEDIQDNIGNSKMDAESDANTRKTIFALGQAGFGAAGKLLGA